MALKPRWTFPLNFRVEDKSTLDTATEIAKRRGSDLTSVIRLALQEYVQRNKAGLANETKIDQFVGDPSFKALPSYTRLLKPEELRGWTNDEVIYLSKLVRSRKEELEAELLRRGYLMFRWD